MTKTHQSHQLVQVKLWLGLKLLWLEEESQQELVLWMELGHLQNKFLSRSSIKIQILCQGGTHWEGHKMDTQGENGQKVYSEWLQKTPTWTTGFLGPGPITLTDDGSTATIIAAVGHLGTWVVGSIVPGSAGESDTAWLWTITWIHKYLL